MVLGVFGIQLKPKGILDVINDGINPEWDGTVKGHGEAMFTLPPIILDKYFTVDPFVERMPK